MAGVPGNASGDNQDSGLTILPLSPTVMAGVPGKASGNDED